MPISRPLWGSAARDSRFDTIVVGAGGGAAGPFAGCLLARAGFTPIGALSGPNDQF